jgi:hypothetical protein
VTEIKPSLKYVSLYSTILALLLLTSCSLTRNDVIGTWKEQFGDTLTIFNDNTFLLTKQTPGKTGQINSVDSSKIVMTGRWTLNKKTIHFQFVDTTQNFGGGCRSYQYWWIRSSKKQLIRPDNCKIPTDHFIAIVKVD